MILFGNKVFEDFIQVKMRSYWIRVGPDPVSGFFIRERRRRFEYRDTESTHTEGRFWPCDDGNRLELRSCKPKNTKDFQQPLETKKRESGSLLSSPQREHGPAATLISDF